MAKALDRNDNCFDFIRLFAAVTVVFNHTVEHLGIPFLWVEPGVYDTWFFDGVQLFFVLSGFLIYRSYEKLEERGKPRKQYYINRFLRIAPGIYVYAIIAVILLLIIGVISIGDIFTIGFVGWFASNIALIPVYHPGIFEDFGVGVLNGSLWTIPAEFSFYLAVPIIYYIFKKTSVKTMLITVFVVAIAGNFWEWILLQDPNESLFEKFYVVSFVPHLVHFGLGILWYKYWDKVPQNGLLALAGVLMYWFIYTSSFSIDSQLGMFYDIIVMFPLSYAIIWFGFNAPKVLNTFTKYGDLSFGVYIWHMVVINTFLYFGIHEMYNANLVHMTVFAISMILAMLSWHLVEKPALKLKKFTSRSESVEKVSEEKLTTTERAF